MLVRTGDLKPEGLHLDLHFEPVSLSYEGGLEIGVGEAALNARIVPHRGGLRCSGRLETTAFVPCSRCLGPYAMTVGRDFDLTCLPAPHGRNDDAKAHEEMDLQISRDELDVSYLDGEGHLDMKGLAAEQIYLSLPMKPLCDESCKGLCPGCGSNLNLESCRCAASEGASNA